MKKGYVYTGIVERVDFPNKGRVVTEEGIVTVKDCLSGQKVEFFINKLRHGKAEGKLTKVLEPSAAETEKPCCEFYGVCGGCSMQTLSYEGQLEFKSSQVKKLLDAVIDYDYEFEPIEGSPKNMRYRNKMEFSFGDARKDGELTLGHHKKGSFHDILTTDSCMLTDESYGVIMRCVLAVCNEFGLTYFHKLSHIGYLRHLVIRRSEKTEEILVHLVTTSQVADAAFDEEAFLKRLVDVLLEQKLNIAGILHSVNDSVADVVRSDSMTLLYGKDYITEELLGLKFKISPYSFFQTNSLGAEVLYNKARSYVGETKGMKVFDLYSGTGTIAQMLSAAASEVTGVEIVEEAVEAARMNAELNGLTNCSFIAGDVLKVLDSLEDKPDIIVLDPPREGVHPKALQKIINYGVDKLVYISCKPTSLARDLELLHENGYRVVKAGCVDMFPMTANVETVCLLSKLHEAKHHVNVTLDMDELDVTSAESKATYEEIRNWVQDKYGFHVTNLNIAQVKQKHGIIERENYNKAKLEDKKQPGCPEDKVKAIEAAMRHYQMI